MQFIVTGLDGNDPQALDRRLAARDAHLSGLKALKEQGRVLFAAARIDSTERMVGSVLIVDFPSRDELKAWLKVEPYVTGNVWQSVSIDDCKVPQLFLSSRSSQ